MKDKIIIAGFGGQGVVFAGNIIANAAMKEGKEVCNMISYGAEMRGGTANSSVIISDKKIGSPVIVHPNIALIMNQASLDKFEKEIEENGLIIINTSEIKRDILRKDVEIVKINATEIAKELGNERIANLAMIGAYIKNKKTIELDTVLSVIEQVLPKSKQDLIEINKKALTRGYKECS